MKTNNKKKNKINMKNKSTKTDNGKKGENWWKMTKMKNNMMKKEEERRRKKEEEGIKQEEKEK